jgi:hypothetical protein
MQYNYATKRTKSSYMGRYLMEWSFALYGNKYLIKKFLNTNLIIVLLIVYFEL